jgi:hypothetical protein
VAVVVTMVMAVVMTVLFMTVFLMTVLLMSGSALTGRRGRHSTTGLTVITAAVLPSADLDQIVLDRKPKLRGKWGVVCLPVGQRCAEARLGPWFWIWFRHDTDSKSVRPGWRRDPPVDPYSGPG